jgi:hypothetical protein
MKQEVEMFTIKCDNCGTLFEDGYNGYSCWGDVNDAWENASESDWIEADFDVHYCPNCYSYDDNDNLIIKSIPPSEEKKEEAKEGQYEHKCINCSIVFNDDTPNTRLCPVCNTFG